MILFWVMYTTWSQSTMQSFVQNYKLCCIHFNDQKEKFVQSLFPISMPFTVLSVPHHCGRRASVRGRGGRWWWGGAECLTRTNAELLPLWIILGTECKTDISDHAHMSANCWVVKPVFRRMPSSIYLDALGCIAYQCQWLPLSPCVLKGITCSL